MLKIQKLVKPNKRSGYELAPGKTTKVRGFTIVNTNSFTVWVDKFTRKYKVARRKK